MKAQNKIIYTAFIAFAYNSGSIQLIFLYWSNGIELI